MTSSTICNFGELLPTNTQKKEGCSFFESCDFFISTEKKTKRKFFENYLDTQICGLQKKFLFLFKLEVYQG